VLKLRANTRERLSPTFSQGNGVPHFCETWKNADVGLRVTLPVTPSNTVVFKNLSVTIFCHLSLKIVTSKQILWQKFTEFNLGSLRCSPDSLVGWGKGHLLLTLNVDLSPSTPAASRSCLLKFHYFFFQQFKHYWHNLLGGKLVIMLVPLL